ncbi:MAG: c-type cytochrome, partial [Zoogloea sp.]|nr:c-type cytochrome [Zoogloea sp.]
AACHGLDGNSASADYPRLAGQYADYVAQARADYQRGKRSDPTMRAMSAGLSKQDVQDLAAWFAAQRGLTVAR